MGPEYKILNSYSCHGELKSARDPTLQGPAPSSVKCLAALLLSQHPTTANQLISTAPFATLAIGPATKSDCGPENSFATTGSQGSVDLPVRGASSAGITVCGTPYGPLDEGTDLLR